jgi:hypothetical protein
MPRYLATDHAIARLRERFPGLALVAGHGLAAKQWLARLASRAVVAGEQAGRDLLLRLELPTNAGPTRLYLPVTPHPGDTWTIRTTLTEEQALANLESHANKVRASWRARKGFTRPHLKRDRSARGFLDTAA